MENNFELFQDDIDWLLHHTSPWSTLENKWKNTYAARTSDIGKNINSLELLFDKWPLFHHADAPRLVRKELKI